MLSTYSSLKENKVHFIFLFLLSLNYLFPLLFFNSITLFYHDALDSEIVYNKIIGQLFSNTENPFDIFLGGSIKAEYLRRIFQPYIYLYSILNFEFSYWLVDALVKLTSYVTFFTLAKKINKNIFICGLIACLYASSNLPTHAGFGLAFFPYIIYLTLYKEKLKIKHYILIIFFGLNSDLIHAGFAMPGLIILILFLINQKIQFYNLIKISALFSFFIILSNINLIIISLGDQVFHRQEFVRESQTLWQTFLSTIIDLFKIPQTFSYSSVYIIPYTIFLIPTFFLGFFSKIKEAKVIWIFLIFFSLFLALINTQIIENFLNNSTGFFKTISWNYLSRSYNLFYSLLLIFLLIEKNYQLKTLKIIIFFAIIFFQINSSIVPLYKDKILKQKDYQNLYTFKGYYNYDDYNKIKNVVKNERTLSIGLDPMAAVMNGIYTVDGYHNIYPLSYKKKFIEVIQKELSKNLDLHKYYNNWGSRVYAFIDNPNNIEINFKAAKKIGAKFVISKYKINNNEIELIPLLNKTNGIKLYKIK